MDAKHLSSVAREAPAGTRDVFVFSYCPSYRGDGGGGFEWRETEEEALDAFRAFTKNGLEGYDCTLRLMPVPARLTRDEITDYLDAQIDFRELLTPPQWME